MLIFGTFEEKSQIYVNKWFFFFFFFCDGQKHIFGTFEVKKCSIFGTFEEKSHISVKKNGVFCCDG